MPLPPQILVFSTGPRWKSRSKVTLMPGRTGLIQVIQRMVAKPGLRMMYAHVLLG